MAEATTLGVWRSRLGVTLLAWMGTTVSATLAYGWLMEAVSFEAFGWSLVGVFVVAPATLLVWSLVELARRPRTSWPALATLLLFSALFVVGSRWLAITGGHLKLASHRPSYDAVVRDAAAGRLPGVGSGPSWVEGERHGVRYIAAWDRGRIVIFPWDHDPHGGWLGVVYDERGCLPEPRQTATLPTLPEATGDPPVMKNAGRLDQRFHLSGNYCLSYFMGM